MLLWLDPRIDRGAPQAARHFAEAELLLPPPIDEGPFCVIEMLVAFLHTPPPKWLGYGGALRFRIRGPRTGNGVKSFVD